MGLTAGLGPGLTAGLGPGLTVDRTAGRVLGRPSRGRQVRGGATA